mgnify:CR=1 FL=1
MFFHHPIVSRLIVVPPMNKTACFHVPLLIPSLQLLPYTSYKRAESVQPFVYDFFIQLYCFGGDMIIYSKGLNICFVFFTEEIYRIGGIQRRKTLDECLYLCCQSIVSPSLLHYISIETMDYRWSIFRGRKREKKNPHTTKDSRRIWEA